MPTPTADQIRDARKALADTGLMRLVEIGDGRRMVADEPAHAVLAEAYNYLAAMPAELAD